MEEQNTIANEEKTWRTISKFRAWNNAKTVTRFTDKFGDVGRAMVAEAAAVSVNVYLTNAQKRGLSFRTVDDVLSQYLRVSDIMGLQPQVVEKTPDRTMIKLCEGIGSCPIMITTESGCKGICKSTGDTLGGLVNWKVSAPKLLVRGDPVCEVLWEGPRSAGSASPAIKDSRLTDEVQRLKARASFLGWLGGTVNNLAFLRFGEHGLELIREMAKEGGQLQVQRLKKRDIKVTNLEEFISWYVKWTGDLGVGKVELVERTPKRARLRLCEGEEVCPNNNQTKEVVEALAWGDRTLASVIGATIRFEKYLPLGDPYCELVYETWK